MLEILIGENNCKLSLGNYGGESFTMFEEV